MTERQLPNLTDKKAITQLLRAEAKTPLYRLSEKQTLKTAKESFYKYATEGDLLAQRVVDRTISLIDGIDQWLPQDGNGQEPQFRVELDARVKTPLTDFEQAALDARKRSESAYIASYSRWHKNEADPKAAAYKKLGELRTEAQEKLRQKNEHLADVVEIYEEVTPIFPVAKKDSWLKKHTPQAVRTAVAIGVTALAIHGGGALKPEALVYADQPNKTPIPAPTDIVDTQPSDHPSGKDRNVEPGNSGTQGKSESNPDGNGVDKPYPADKQPARSQGRNDNDGNNGCGNDNDFSDDNNGNCGGKKKETPTPPPPISTPTPQESPTPTATTTPPGETPSPTPTPPEATSTPTPPPGATPTQPAGAIPPAVTPGVEKPAQPQPTPPTTVPVEKQPPTLPPTLPKAGEIPLPAVWLAGLGVSLAAAGSRLKKWGWRK